jgi:hypothetical protein
MNEMNIIKRFQKWLEMPVIDHRMERYLANSTDEADLEYRLKRWQYMTEYERSLY